MLWNDTLVMVAFRGTDETRDWLTNLDMLPRRSPFGPIHRGFAKATARLWPQLVTILKRALDRQKPIWLTGHSLGGAMAQICTMRLLTETAWNPTCVYTFAQPRAAGRGFARRIEKAAVPYYRFVNNVDLITSIPTGLFRTHVGREIYVAASGGIFPDGAGFALKARDAFNQGQPEFPSILLGRKRELLTLARVSAHGMERYVVPLLGTVADGAA